MRRFLRALPGVVLVLSCWLPARAQPLVVPLTGQRTRPIESEALFYTLFSDFFSENDNTTYVQTGDIPAMWLRDSSAQTIPYLRFADAYPVLAARFAGVIERNAKNILTDPYANAFNAKYAAWERKWEADSLAWPVLLAWVYRARTHRDIMFTPNLHRALRAIVDTYRCEQLHATCSRYTADGRSSAPFNTDTGMIWTAYRPSDDPVRYHFNIPQEMIAVIALQDLARLAVDGYGDNNLANEAASIASQVYAGIERYGRVWNPAYGGWIYVYETDGLGNDLYADDANLPDLTGLPYIGWCSAYDPAYLNTRTYVLSAFNPWYFRGLYGEGLGSPHTPAGFVWPLGIITRALTATSAVETSQSITTLAETDSNDGLIHESFWPDAYWLFTRADFAWGNALYAELLFRSVAGFPAVPFTAYDTAAIPFERVDTTPELTRTLVQLQDSALLYAALGTLLTRADNHTIIPGVEQAMASSTNAHGPNWHEVQDLP